MGKSILIGGGSGFVGRTLCRELLDRGDSVAVLTRNPDAARDRLDPGVRLIGALSEIAGTETFDAVVNLAGAGVADARWTRERKRLLYRSRIDSTEAMVQFIRARNVRPAVFLCASGVGYYGYRDDEVLTESDGPGNDFLSHLCVDWENSATQVEAFGVRCCRLRIGMVVDRGGGALARMLPAFKAGVGGPLGSGRQWVSWIHAQDLVGIIMFAIDRPSLEGAVNCVAPGAVPQREFARQLGEALHRPAFMPAPAFVLRLLFGEMAGLLLKGQRAAPDKIRRAGYVFRYPAAAEALEASCG